MQWDARHFGRILQIIFHLLAEEIEAGVLGKDDYPRWEGGEVDM